MASYYDAVLLAIPVTFTLVAALIIAVGLPTLAAPGATLLPIALVGHGLFVRGPTEDRVLRDGTE